MEDEKILIIGGIRNGKTLIQELIEQKRKMVEELEKKMFEQQGIPASVVEELNDLAIELNVTGCLVFSPNEEPQDKMTDLLEIYSAPKEVERLGSSFATRAPHKKKQNEMKFPKNVNSVPNRSKSKFSRRGHRGH